MVHRDWRAGGARVPHVAARASHRGGARRGCACNQISRVQLLPSEFSGPRLFPAVAGASDAPSGRRKLAPEPPLRSCEAATPRRKTGHLDMAATAVAKVRQRSAAVTLNTATGAAAVSGVAQATGGACAPPFGDGMSCFCHVTATSRAHATPPNLRAARPISSQAIRGACARPCRSRRICVRRCVCWVFGDVHASRSHVSGWDPAPQIGTCLRFAPPPSLPAAVAAARRCRSPRGCSAHCAPRRERRAARARRYDALTWR